MKTKLLIIVFLFFAIVGLSFTSIENIKPENCETAAACGKCGDGKCVRQCGETPTSCPRDCGITSSLK